MSEIHLQVLAGFANRVRALVSGICLAEDYGIKLVIHWSIDHACAARFESLLDPTSLPPFVSFTHLPLLKAYSCLSSEDMAHVKKTWDRQKPLVLKSYGHFHTTDRERWIQHYRALKPTQEILNAVEQRLPPFDQTRFLGVHIRRGDNVKSIEQSPLSAFYRVLDKDDSFLVVATDDEVVRAEMKDRYKGRVWFPATILERHTEEGMKDGVIDFFSLTMCPKILGSVYSSFTDMAALYSGSELILAKC
jgi:hypothetical protein